MTNPEHIEQMTLHELLTEAQFIANGCRDPVVQRMARILATVIERIIYAPPQHTTLR